VSGQPVLYLGADRHQHPRVTRTEPTTARDARAPGNGSDLVGAHETLLPLPMTTRRRRGRRQFTIAILSFRYCGLGGCRDRVVAVTLVNFGPRRRSKRSCHPEPVWLGAKRRSGCWIDPTPEVSCAQLGVAEASEFSWFRKSRWTSPVSSSSVLLHTRTWASARRQRAAVCSAGRASRLRVVE
jgi:hypothetical protein